MQGAEPQHAVGGHHGSEEMAGMSVAHTWVPPAGRGPSREAAAEHLDAGDPPLNADTFYDHRVGCDSGPVSCLPWTWTSPFGAPTYLHTLKGITYKLL